LAYIFGKQIMEVIEYAKHHWYFALPIAGLFFVSIAYTFKRIEDNILKRRKKRYENQNSTATAE